MARDLGTHDREWSIIVVDRTASRHDIDSTGRASPAPMRPKYPFSQIHLKLAENTQKKCFCLLHSIWFVGRTCACFNSAAPQPRVMCMDQNRDQVPECLKLPLIASLEKLCVSFGDYPCTLLKGRLSSTSGRLVSHVPDPRPRGLDHQDSLAMQLVPRS